LTLHYAVNFPDAPKLITVFVAGAHDYHYSVLNSLPPFIQVEEKADAENKK
jgi:hypothetical protein